MTSKKKNGMFPVRVGESHGNTRKTSWLAITSAGPESLKASYHGTVM